MGTGTDATNPILNSSTRSSSRDPWYSSVMFCQNRRLSLHSSVYTVYTVQNSSIYRTQLWTSEAFALGHGWTWHGSFGHHHLHKLLIVDLTVAIHVGFTDHLIDFLISKLPQWNIMKYPSQVTSHKSEQYAWKLSMFTKIRSKMTLKLHVGYHVYS